MTPDHPEFPVTSRKLKRYTLTQCSPLGCFYVVGFRLRGPLWHILALDHQYSNVTRWEIVELLLSLESHRKSLKCLRTTSKCSRKTDVCRRLTSKCHRKPRFAVRARELWFVLYISDCISHRVFGWPLDHMNVFHDKVYFEKSSEDTKCHEKSRRSTRNVIGKVVGRQEM